MECLFLKIEWFRKKRRSLIIDEGEIRTFSEKSTESNYETSEERWKSGSELDLGK